MKAVGYNFVTRIAGFIVLVPLLLLSAVAQESAMAAGDAAMGEEVYLAHSCYGCHGYNGTGSTPLANRDTGILLSEPGFIAFLRMRSELNPILPSTLMPNYSEGSLTDADARHLYAYIRSFSDTPPPVDEIPAMQRILEAAR